MAIHRGPNIVRDGLVFSMDVTSPRCNPGTSVNVTDLTGNWGGFANGGTPTIQDSTTNRKNISFNGGSWIETPTVNPIPTFSSYTVMSIVYPTSFTNGEGYAAVLNISDGTNHICSNYIETAGTMRAWIQTNAGGSVIQTASGPSVPLNTWSILFWVWEDGVGHDYYVYNNANGLTSSTSATNANNIRTNDTSSTMTIGRWRNSGYEFIGNMLNVSMYDRALTVNEINQNIDVFKSRI